MAILVLPYTSKKAYAQDIQTGHWVDVYLGNPVPIFQLCAGSGVSCVIGDWRPPGEQ